LRESLPSGLLVLHRLASVVAAAPYSVQHVLERIATEFREAFALERALVVRHRVDESTLHAVVQQGVDWPGEDWLPIEEFPFLVRALAIRRPVLVRDARAEAAVPTEIVERFGVHSIVAAPLLIEGRCLGFLVGDRAGREFSLDPGDLDVLAALGTVAAVFVDKADQLAELERALDNLRQLDQAKSDFVSIASHELRTPLAVAHGVATTLHLRSDELRADQLRELLRALYEQTSRLSVLVDQLLDLSRLEAGAIEVRSERFRCRDRVKALVHRIAPERGDDVIVAVDPAFDVETDPLAFERVLSNLLDNALRYGAPPIEVRAQCADAVQVTVCDSGDGVDPRLVPRMFERFTRSGAMLDRRSGGAGLGLAIASSYAEAVGGRLSYEPGVPSGACFTFELPA
jgi:signal transduction histidine kinase